MSQMAEREPNEQQEEQEEREEQQEKKSGGGKKALVTILVILAVLIVAAVVAVLAVRSSLIGGDMAQRLAAQDAGFDVSEISAAHADLEFEDGQFRYEVEFYANGMEFDYLLAAKDGTILKREGEGIPKTPQQTTTASAPAETTASIETTAQAPDTTAPLPLDTTALTARETTTSASVTESTAAVQGGAGTTLDSAKRKALEDAGIEGFDLNAFQVAANDADDGVQVYELEWTVENTRYDYEIRVADGTIKKRSRELLGYQATGGETTLELAKEIALKDVYLTEEDVRFTEQKRDTEDGQTVFELTFFQDTTEYDYTIAADGTILQAQTDYAN